MINERFCMNNNYNDYDNTIHDYNEEYIAGFKHTIHQLSSFKTDKKRYIRNHKDLAEMWRYIELLADEIELPGSCHDKPMRGKEARQYRLRHFHVEGDMIVVYCYNHMNDIYLVDLWHVASHDYLNKYYPNFK